MKSLIKFILICTGIVTVTSFLIHFESSGDIPKDVGNITETAVRNTLNTTSEAWDSIKVYLTPPLDTLYNKFNPNY